ncbi:anti-sigma F factor [Holdemania filiformis]|uniref:anti-sigma F factor n=1 Tax=Holdemania filiformis TaxID=61171 RepID=UPI002670B9B9|nr:anti-sigma F factor [Holdemania filiformis]
MNRMTLSFDAKLENEAFARTSAVAFLMPLNPTVDEIMEIKTILAEAVVNSMIHGYQGREEGQVRVSVSYDETHRVMIEVQDSGVGIEDITLARQPLYTTRADLERSGMGMTIMESFSDEFEICSHPGEGTTVRLVKQLQFHE